MPGPSLKVRSSQPAPFGKASPIATAAERVGGVHGKVLVAPALVM